MTKLERLKATRAAHRGVVSKIEKETQELLAEEFLVQEGGSRLEVISCLLENKLKTLNEIDDEIISLCPVDDIPTEIEESEEIMARIIKCQKKIEGSRANNAQPTVHVQPEHASQASASYVSVKPRLPKLTLPKFKGDVTQWNSFWDSFKSAIHLNTAISTVDKFNYLNSLLEGNAARVIQGLTLTTSNYTAAVDMLKERFGKTQLIISAHMDEILKIQASIDGRLGSLRYVYDNISVHVRGLAALGVSSEQYGSLLIPIIMSKLPSDVRLQIARKATTDVWKIDELLKTIKTEIDARESSEGAKTKSSVMEGPKLHNSSRNHSPPSASALLSRNAPRNSTEEFKIRCAFCGNFHYSASCEKVVDYESRKKILANDDRCFNCLRKGHRVKQCRSERNCRHCNKRHHQSICDQSQTKAHASISEEFTANNDPTIATTSTTNSSNASKPKTVLLQTARAEALDETGNSKTTVRILFDTGSQRSYVTENLRSKLKLKSVQQERLNLNTFGEARCKSQKCDLVHLQLKRPGSFGDEVISISALTFPVICSPLPTRVKINFPHLQGLELADDLSEPQDSIDVLVGSDFYWDIVTGDTVTGDGPTALSSKLGWLLSGPIKGSRANNCTVSNLIISGQPPLLNEAKEKDEVTEMLRHFWATESIGINEVATQECNQALKFEDELNIAHNGQIYEVALPWKDDCFPATDNRLMCVSRLNFLHRKLSKERTLLNEYHTIIKEQEKNGIIEKADDGRNEDKIKGIYYSPHHAVVRKDRETTKVRIVYDGSAKPSRNESSLNDCLQIGPNFIPRIFDVLTKFRSKHVGLTADIEKAFLNVGIKDEHKDMLRFLWFDDPNADKLQTVSYRFNRLVFGLRPSPSILGSTIKHHVRLFKQDEPEIAQLLEDSFYVDDLITGEDDDQQASVIYQKAKEIMAKGGFNLRKWHSNSKRLLQEIANSEATQETKERADKKGIPDATEEDDESYAKSSTGLSGGTSDEEQVVKVLGIKWNTSTDEFYFTFEGLYDYGNSLPITRRSVLKITAKIFDPLGILSPFVIRLKMFFQGLCTEGLNWDQPLLGEKLKTWNAIFQELKALELIRIPRCYFTHSSSIIDVQLHAFSDASEKAYAAVLYMRTSYSDGHVQTRLVTSKTRVAPMKKQSIPRLELLGAAILARLVSAVSTILQQKINRVVYWVDSRAALCWIKNEKPWKQYVRHRVEEIRQLTNKEDWRHCPGDLNPADLPSRGMTGSEMSRSTMWWNGPSFLCLSEEEWPQDKSSSETSETALSEIVKNPPEVSHTLTSSENQPAEINLSQVIDCDRFSCLDRLLRVTAYVLRFILNIKRKQSKDADDNREEETNREDSNELNARELNQAESFWIRTVQSNAFSSEISYIQRGHQVKPRRVDQFALFLDDNKVLRCRGRLNNSSLQLETKNPILMPSSHQFVELLIRQTHQKVRHSSVNNTLTTIRERFWILRGRQSVKRVLKRCVTCRKLEGLSYPYCNSPDLPSVRVSDDPPFTHVGIDFAGPVYVRASSPSGSDNDKSYVCLFTCASTRAVHLELTRNLTVDSFLLAFRRFTSRRGLPANLISDNAKTFKGSSREIVKIARSKEVLRYLTNNRISWKFIVERAPWWGGFWERLIQSVKRCLKKSIGRTTLTHDALHTLLVEVEAVVNSRPLTYVEDDQDGVSYALSPSHLINGRRITDSPNGGHFEVVSTNASLSKKAKHHRHLLQQFTNQWRKSYLLSLRERHAQSSRHRKGAEIAVGDVVILKNDSTQRMFWKLAAVEELLTGRDGNVRAARVKVANADRNPRLFTRSVKHLFPLEVNVNCQTDQQEECDQDACVAPESTRAPEFNVPATRPRRNAALVGELNRRFHS